jgi:hypothetical protein
MPVKTAKEAFTMTAQPALGAMQEQGASPNLFLINPSGNLKFVTGQTKQIGSPTTAYVFIAIFVLVALGIGGYFGYKMIQYNQLETSGVPDEAEITDGTSTRGRRGGTTYNVTYEYRVNGRTYTRDQDISGTLWNKIDRVGTGMEVDIKYLASDPSIVVLAGEFKDDTEKNRDTLVLAIAVPICLGIALLIFMNNQTNQKLANEGQLLRGQVVSAVGRRGSKNTYNVTLKYDFTTPNGKQITKQQVQNRPDLRNGPLPSPGTPVAVLYVNDKLQRLM